MKTSPLLVAAPGKPQDDACQASCVDWYGNVRPILIGDRVYALMGYELIEGRVYDESLTNTSWPNSIWCMTTRRH